MTTHPTPCTGAAEAPGTPATAAPRLRHVRPTARPMARPAAVPFSALLLLLALLPHALAQSRDVGGVLAALEARAAEVVDLAFVLEGQLVDEGGQVFRIEVEVQAIPGIPAAGIYIVQPDALADNQVVVDGDVVRNYTFLTNQVSLYRLDDPDAFGGLIEAGGDGGMPISLDLAAVFAGWDAQVVGEEGTPRGTALVLRFDNRDPEAQIQYVLATVLDGAWDPWRLVFYRAGDALFADLRFVDLEVNQGLTRADVTYLPEDAEVLDRRR
jgi:outer membrane lipoprotein-sorting protein